MLCLSDDEGVISLNEKIYYSTALMETHRNAGLVHGTVVPTGFALFGILMIMGTFAHQKIRKSGRFEVSVCHVSVTVIQDNSNEKY